MPKACTWIDKRIIDEIVECSRLSTSSERGVRYHLRLYAEHLESRCVPFETADENDVLLFYEHVCSFLSSSTAVQALNSVKRLHRWVSEGAVEKVGRGRKRPSRTAGDGVRKALSPTEARLVMDACETRRDAALIALLLEGALKPGEVRAANVGDVSFLEGCAVMVVKPSASRPESVMRLPKAAASKLERYLEERKPRSSDEPLFTSESTRSFGTRLADRSIREVVKPIFSRAGIPGTAGDYDLRKTALLLARDVGAKDEDLVRFARLRSMSTVKDADNLYRYASDGPQELLSRALASGNPGERACVAEAREVKQLLEAFDDDTLLLVTISETGELTVSPFETAAGC